jgi:hypothetical protein
MHATASQPTARHLRKGVTAAYWGSSGRRFKSCQPDNCQPDNCQPDNENHGLNCGDSPSPAADARACGTSLAPQPRGVPSRHFPESMVAASMSVSAADRACSRGEVSLSEVARALAPSKRTASWLPSR